MSDTTQVTSKSSSLFLRRTSQSKMPLKKKIVQIYEAFFRGEDPAIGNANFWDELFLLKVNTTVLENEFEKMSEEQLIALKETINYLFYKCVETLIVDHPIRVSNALLTLCALIRGVFKKNLADFGFDVINILVGFDSADTQMQVFVEHLNRLLSGDSPLVLKELALSVLLVLVTATDNVSQNTMLEYLMINSVFESIVQMLANVTARLAHGSNAVLLLTILVQYRKYESANPYIARLSILDDELALNGFAQVVSTILTNFNRKYQAAVAAPDTGILASLSNMVGSMFVGEERKVEPVLGIDSILLALYEAIHLNRNFITTLTQSHATTTPTTPPTTPTVPGDKTLQASESTSLTTDQADQPTNLLVTFLEYSSFIMQDVKNPPRANNAKLCLIILTCVVEDQYANSLMHDVNMSFRVPLHRLPMRHRKVATDKRPASRPLACALLDLMVEFITSHMMKSMPVDLYMKSLGVTHRILCYQKKCRVRLQYGWRELWTALINLLKFILSNESYLLKKHNIFDMSSRVINIFNLFITYGDTFLPNANSYDELYYEIIRVHQIFDNLHSMTLRYTSGDGPWKQMAIQLTSTLVNIRAIINHFSPKVDSWAATNHLSSLTEEQVLNVVRDNYDTLTLKIQENLDQFERHAEQPKETAYFTQLVRQIISDVRISITASISQHHGMELSRDT